MGMDHTIECKKRVPEALVKAIASVKLGKTPGTINVSTPKDWSLSRHTHLIGEKWLRL
ncbi:hypothetical protein PAISLEY_47 [Paenibacillus phage Paisley]|uniref:Uncharacterized protein n=1 Tax=Paenibacillus phage Paisley TaxID=1702259 RepID=A0A0K2CYP9_9CAUD|nr:hypothetical protein PAISLEY_47 [Paenibacillus phage Paisley]